MGKSPILTQIFKTHSCIGSCKLQHDITDQFFPNGNQTVTWISTKCAHDSKSIVMMLIFISKISDLLPLFYSFQPNHCYARDISTHRPKCLVWKWLCSSSNTSVKNKYPCLLKRKFILSPQNMLRDSTNKDVKDSDSINMSFWETDWSISQ